MNLDLINGIFNNLKENKFVQDFIKELSNYLENNLDSNTKICNDDNKWNDLNLDKDLTLYDEKIIVKFRDEMFSQRSKILQNYAKDTKEKGEMFYIYDTSTNQNNAYNLSYCDINRSHEVLTKLVEELPVGSKLGSVLRKKGEDFILDVEATKEVSKKINSMIKEKIKEQNQYLESKRIDGHVYEVGEKYSGRIWLYDLNNILGGGIEGIEEIKFPKDLYETAKEGDLFLYENGEYKKHE